jgi:hypothetical protein|tara:strand:- start:159 stop:527 length:369 start_codon:yes stop_codon:yes gene_type:complete
LAKAALVQECREVGIPVPKSAKVDDIKHRLRHWRPGKGWLFRLCRPNSRKENHPVGMLEEWDKVYWVPNSRMAKMIAESNLVFILGRTLEAPDDAIMLDVPKDFSNKWPLGGIDGSNKRTDS